MICTWIHMLDNMEPIVRKEDVVAHDYVATAGNYFIGISTHASQLSHHSPPDSPASSQLTHHEHHTRGQLRIKHHNNYTVWHQRGGDRIKTTITWMSDYRDLSTLCIKQTPHLGCCGSGCGLIKMRSEYKLKMLVRTDLIFVIFSPQMYFWAQFFSTWKRVNCGKINFATKCVNFHKTDFFKKIA